MPYSGEGACKVGANLLNNYGEAVAMILFGIGFGNLLLQRNLIKKIIGLNIMDTAIYLFLAEKGYIAGLVLTGIVVSVSVSALMLSITVRLYQRYLTLDLDEITVRLKKEGL